MSKLPVPYRPIHDLPLGTAAWHEFSPKDIPHFRPGDFWLSHLPSGEAIGIRDDRHVLIVGGTRGGKGASYIIPNLCSWKGSVVVIDPKGENAMITARRRAGGSSYCYGMGQRVFVLDPFEAASTDYDDLSDLRACFNPLDCIRLDDEEAIDVAAGIADALVVSESTAEPIFEDTARWYTKILNLHVRSSPDYLDEERTLNTVRTLLLVGNADIANLLALNGQDDAMSGLEHLFLRMKNNRAFGGVIASAGARLLRFMQETPKFFESIIQVAVTNTDFLDSPAMKRCVSRSDFALHQLKTDPRGISVYLTLPQRYMRTHYRWLRVMTSLITAEMERNKEVPATGHQTLMVLDEFASLKRMKSIEDAVAQIAGFGVKLVIAVQNLPQLKELYKDSWETFISNIGTKLFFNIEDNFTREYVSKLIGDCEVIRTSHSHSTTKGQTSGWSISTTVGNSSNYTFGPNGGSSSYGYSSSTTQSQSGGSSYSSTSGTSESIHKRPLLAPDEVGRMFSNPERPAALVLVSGYQPIALRRSTYFSEFMWAGYYNRHKNHPAPLMLPQVEAKRITLKRDAEARKAAALARKQALCRERERAARLVAKKAEEIAAARIAHRRELRIIGGISAVALVGLYLLGTSAVNAPLLYVSIEPELAAPLIAPSKPDEFLAAIDRLTAKKQR